MELNTDKYETFILIDRSDSRLEKRIVVNLQNNILNSWVYISNFPGYQNSRVFNFMPMQLLPIKKIIADEKIQHKGRIQPPGLHRVIQKIIGNKIVFNFMISDDAVVIEWNELFGMLDNVVKEKNDNLKQVVVIPTSLLEYFPGYLNKDGPINSPETKKTEDLPLKPESSMNPWP